MEPELPRMRELVAEDRVSLGSEPVALVGEPRHCTGIVRVHNPRECAVKLKRIRLRTSADGLSNTCEAAVVEAKVAAVLCPGETRELRIKLRLPLGTPPGCYEAWVDTADKTSLPVSIHVLESRRIRFWPPTIEHTVRACETFTTRVNAFNLGNVTLELPKRAAVELHAVDRDWPDYFHAAARTHGDQGHAVFLDHFVERLGADEPGFGRAKLLSGAGPLAPQTGRLLEMAISIPKRLRTGRSYQAAVRLGVGLFQMTLYLSPRVLTARDSG